jgi:hypothetical protein
MDPHLDLMTPAEFCRRAGLNPETLRYYRNRGTLGPVYRLGRMHVYTQANLDAYLNREDGRKNRHPKGLVELCGELGIVMNPEQNSENVVQSY